MERLKSVVAIKRILILSGKTEILDFKADDVIGW